MEQNPNKNNTSRMLFPDRGRSKVFVFTHKSDFSPGNLENFLQSESAKKMVFDPSSLKLQSFVDLRFVVEKL